MIKITHAMVLAAGLGTRMRPITDRLPKCLIPVSGRALIDRTIDRFQEAGVKTVVVNVHHLADMVERHLKARTQPNILISREVERLETGGGVKNALPLLGAAPFFVANADAMWLNGPQGTLKRMMERWDDADMDALLLMHSTVDAYGYEGPGDFMVDAVGRLTRRPEREVVPNLFAGVQVLSPRLFEGTPDVPFSLNVVYDKAIAAGRLFGIVHDGEWFHVGTPEGLAEAEAYLSVRFAGKPRR